jgi:uncharacterized protein YndB with AHSA1/START domain
MPMNADAVKTQTQMLIRRPVAEVFEAFIDPAITTQFWFTKSSGRLDAGMPVAWEWEMYGASARVIVKTIEANRRILIDWGDESGMTQVEWRFAEQSGGTMVTITNTGFAGDDDSIVAQAVDSAEGFTIVLCGLKALLEHGIRLNLIADKAPEAHVK